MTTGSTGKAPLADATRETGIEQAAQRLLVEVTAEDVLRDRGAPSWLRLAEKPPASKDPHPGGEFPLVLWGIPPGGFLVQAPTSLWCVRRP